MNTKEELTIRQVADLLGLNYVTVMRYIHTNKLRAIKRGGRWRIEREEYERFLREGNWREDEESKVQG